MARYTVRFLTHGDQIFGQDLFEAENDGAAIRHCNQKLKSPLGKGHEIWQDNRMVHRQIYLAGR
jgi:hypothetical protein